MGYAILQFNGLQSCVRHGITAETLEYDSGHWGPSDCLWLVPEGAAPIWEETETVWVAYWYSFVCGRFVHTARAEIELFFNNESLRMFP